MKPENIACPDCKGPMVSRQNRATGQRFWSCAAYPTCKGTRNTDGEAPRRYESDDESIGTESPSERQRRNDRRRWE